ncbi:DUF5677 domain-containing protein [Pseudoclavibacter helvolus]|uniref:DUF5677 domain-containing protein n=1 Tax=Pseudoclavibacter helvolus TaxID=255205 RepID=UPI0024AD37BA|nr:DUF5677 domain-containing protein [Pseudoclavibacter helvolus]
MPEMPTESPFGPGVHTAATGDSVGYSFKDPTVNWPSSFWDRLPSEVRSDINAWMATVGPGSGILYPLLESDAARMILTAAINDAMSLIAHMDRLEGRSAAHSARGLFEHLINFIDVDQSAVNTPTRYLDHRHITEERVAQRRWYLSLLPKKDARKEATRLDRLNRHSSREAKTAVAAYGTGFKRSWAQGSLKDRATAYGYADDYEAYRILSAVIHGSSGAMSGIVRNQDGMSVFRIGPDLDLAATAYIEGMKSTLSFFTVVFASTDRPEAESMRTATEQLLKHSATIRNELRAIDRSAWPKVPDFPPMAVVAVYRGGVERWFMFYEQTQTLLRSDTPLETPDLTALHEEARRMNWDGGNGRPVTAVLNGVLLTPRADATPIPSASILVPRDLPEVARDQ